MYLRYYWATWEGGEIVFHEKDYDDLKNPSFAPEVDLYALSIPVNTFTVDIVTTDSFSVNDKVDLYDDMNGLWAAFRVKSADRLQPGVVRLVADTWISDLEHATMDAEMYEAEPAGDLIDACIDAGFPNASGMYSIDSSFDNATVTGYCPEQTARERLTWVLFSIGGMVKQSFADVVQIVPIDDEATVIPYNRTFYRPSISNGEWVTAVKVTAFSFTEAQSQAEWEADDSSYRFPLPWVCEEQDFSLTNNSAPSGVPENVVEIGELYLINSGNVNAILNRLAAYYFNRTEVSLDCINNRQFLPGDKVTASMDEEELITGYITQASFQFGLQARSTLKLIGVENAAGAPLTINYVYNNVRISQAKYYLPVGTSFSIENPFIDNTVNGTRYIYGPQTEYATGTMVSGGMTVTVEYDIALENYNGNLIVYSVDGVETSSGIGVIS